MLVTHLDEKGMISKQERTAAFFDADTDPIFAKPAVIDGVYYFPSFKGMVHPVDMNAADPGMLDAWSLLQQEQDRQENWRPGGWQIATAHEAGERLFVLMHPDGENGTHKGGGSEVWIFDVDAKKRRWAHRPQRMGCFHRSDPGRGALPGCGLTAIWTWTCIPRTRANGCVLSAAGHLRRRLFSMRRGNGCAPELPIPCSPGTDLKSVPFKRPFKNKHSEAA